MNVYTVLHQEGNVENKYDTKIIGCMSLYCCLYEFGHGIEKSLDDLDKVRFLYFFLHKSSFFGGYGGLI